MFNRFLKTFTADGQSAQTSGAVFSSSDPIVQDFFSRFAGTSFNNGLYRVLVWNDVQRWNAAVEDAFPAFKGAIVPFGIDWLGRIFALDSRRVVKGRPAVSIFEPGTGQVLEVPCDIESFHDEELVDYKDASLAELYFNEWVRRGGSGPSYSQCVGYQRPLFLGGVDTVENLELIDLDVYWTISVQLIAKLRNVPPGTGVNIARKQ
ncbi:T6SS immunity protein Tdi1 domain-containing protein [Paraburkholderia antibiotica]|uniref:DUF1851 domain-containing protein n=1 Tax=Paraburkholderia antibiotica TaxID=2728839 RepID=A0A7Y0A0I5_9BURK|nr:T6SS immunity protein Tdi1 domain-containing protein [Paraburkholderia antibiotica]NML34241.1 DUF1851 domain-containing protein [Paraburkholderia antibiotica]